MAPTCQVLGRRETSRPRGRAETGCSQEGDLKGELTQRKEMPGAAGAPPTSATSTPRPSPPRAPGGREPPREEGRGPRAALRRRPSEPRPIGGNTAAEHAGSRARCTLGRVVLAGLTPGCSDQRPAACCSFKAPRVAAPDPPDGENVGNTRPRELDRGSLSLWERRKEGASHLPSQVPFRH